MESVYFFYTGCGILVREFESKAYGSASIDVSILPEGSFFGELAVILNLKAYFGLNAGSGRKKKNKIVKGAEMVFIYEIDAAEFIDILKDNPDFQSQVYIRAEVRMAYFKYMTSLREGEYAYNMKIIEIEKNIIEGIRRSQPRDLTDMEKRLYGARIGQPDIELVQEQIDEEKTFEEASESAQNKVIKLLVDLEFKTTQLYG